MQTIPPITRNLIIINVICFLAQFVFERMGIDLTQWLGLHFFLAGQFNVFQFFTYMFLHGSLTHLFFNMFSLWMFGGIIERTLGTQRFLIYYLISGIGAGFCQELWQLGEYYLTGMYAYDFVALGAGSKMAMGSFLNMWTTIGASGACYGVLLAFGMLYPDQRIMLLIPPIPMKAKYFVVGFAAIEAVAAYASNDNVAHFAHLGGMLFGWLLLRHWRKKAQRQQQFGGWQSWSEEQHRKSGFFSSIADRIRRVVGEKSHTETGNAHRAPQRKHEATEPQRTHFEEPKRSKEEQERMNEILDKVRRSGYDCLTTEEKHELFRISKK